MDALLFPLFFFFAPHVSLSLHHPFRVSSPLSNSVLRSAPFLRSGSGLVRKKKVVTCIFYGQTLHRPSFLVGHESRRKVSEPGGGRNRPARGFYPLSSIQSSLAFVRNYFRNVNAIRSSTAAVIVSSFRRIDSFRFVHDFTDGPPFRGLFSSGNDKIWLRVFPVLFCVCYFFTVLSLRIIALGKFCRHCTE